MGKKFRVLIVDDEFLAREGLRRLLGQYPDIEIVGEADSVETAAQAIKVVEPDVVFLDIQMPGETGFNLFNRVDVNFKVVFVTAFDNYAIRAFEVNALDYLLKPLNPLRVAQTIARLGEERSTTNVKGKLNYDDYIFIDTKSRNGFVKVDSIAYIMAAGDYSEIYLNNGEKRMMLRTLREWEEKLPEKYFFRIHRAIIINLSYVEKTKPGIKSTYQIYLRNITTPFTTSRKYGMELRKKFV